MSYQRKKSNYYLHYILRNFLTHITLVNTFTHLWLLETGYAILGSDPITLIHFIFPIPIFAVRCLWIKPDLIRGLHSIIILGRGLLVTALRFNFHHLYIITWFATQILLGLTAEVLLRFASKVLLWFAPSTVIFVKLRSYWTHVLSVIVKGIGLSKKDIVIASKMPILHLLAVRFKRKALQITWLTILSSFIVYAHIVGA